MIFFDVIIYLWRKKGAHPFALFNGVANERGGYFHLGRIDQLYRFAQSFGNSDIFTGPGIDKDLIAFHNLFVIFPFIEQRPVISPNDQRKASVGMFPCERIQRVNGVRRLWHTKLHIRYFEIVIIRQCQSHHLQAYIIWQKTLFLFKRIVGCDHKPDLLQVGEGTEVTGQHKMPHVDGIE
ncbi:hypothetical protein SDC9_173397 [bioreactor metagenome]|uniref:Uncharacterized protein n=1 Tax=bioreactor metagenome TaxID=1076179 RepID=A0A645GH06_9ZZZZ